MLKSLKSKAEAKIHSLQDKYHQFEDEHHKKEEKNQKEPKTATSTSTQIKDEKEKSEKKEGTLTSLKHRLHDAEDYVKKKLDKSNVKEIPLQEKKPTSEKEKPQKESTLASFKHHLHEAEDYVKKKLDKAENAVKQQIEKLDKKVHAAIDDQKEHMNQWIAHKVDERAVKMLQSIEPKIISSADRSVPFECLKSFVNDSIVHVWKDVSDIIRIELQLMITKPKEFHEHRPNVRLWHKVKSLVVYSLYPADLSSKEQIHRTSFVVLKMAQLLTIYAIQPFTFLIIFLTIHKTDEYQLVNFILELKSLQFITIGFMSTFIGYLEYYMFASGPGQPNLIPLTIAGMSIEIILLWAAFFLLKYSKSKESFMATTLKIEQGAQGGRIKYFMMYEAIITMIILTMLTLNLIFGTSPLAEVLYFCRTIYGLLSLPFVIFQVGFFIRVITNATPTGYNKWGHCMPIINQMIVHYSELPYENKEKIDVGDILP